MKRNNLTHDDTRSSCYDLITIHTLVVFLNKWRLTELTGLRVTRILLVFYNKGCGGVLVWFWNNLPQISREIPRDCQTDPYGYPYGHMGQERSRRLADAMMYTTIVRILLHGDDRHCILFNSLIEDGELCAASSEQSLVIQGGD